MTRPILELRNIDKTFRGDIFKKNFHAVKMLSIQFPEKKCTGFIGHNGAGKTTTLKLVLGLIFPDKGEILFKGHPLSREDRHSIGYMPEVNKMPQALTPEEILSFQLQLFASSRLPNLPKKKLVEAKLREVGLWEHRRKKIAQLSKGQGRRVAWGQATIHRPELIILDEPFSGLDPLGRQTMFSWIKDLKESGVSMILCTHDMQTVRGLCDEVVMLQRGAKVASTIDGGQAALPLNARNFLVRVSGLTQSDAEKMLLDFRLPRWSLFSQDHFATAMRFDSATDAQAWLSRLLQSGLIVMHFGEEFDEEEILKFYQSSSAVDAKGV